MIHICGLAAREANVPQSGSQCEHVNLARAQTIHMTDAKLIELVDHI